MPLGGIGSTDFNIADINASYPQLTNQADPNYPYFGIAYLPSPYYVTAPGALQIEITNMETVSTHVANYQLLLHFAIPKQAAKTIEKKES
jgi:hypothetical protein